MLVVGAGLVGLASAWLLQRRGHPVLLVDPAIDGPPAAAAGSWAALGVLMAQVFHRSSGRAWRLRQRSHALWPQWLAALGLEGGE
ncbi:MAG: FAD-dependent oxidoreductase, partial [Prochlorococcaceae cyanobacterium]